LSLKLRVGLTALAVAALVFCVVTLLIRALPLSNVIVLVIAVGSPYVTLVAVAGLVFSALARRFLLSSAAVVVLVATLVVQIPWYYFGHPVESKQDAHIRVLSSNLRKGRADAPSFVGLARASADVVTVSELTPEEVERFSQAGIESVFPYSLLLPAPDAAGIGMWSRFPLAFVPPSRPRDTAILAARLRIPGVRMDPLVASVHIGSPVAHDKDSFADWRTGIADTNEAMTDFTDAAGPAAVIVAGDFNSTPDMRQFRDLLTNGYRDAVEQTGAGFAPTFPSRPWHPPLITIDHLLTRHASATSIRTVYVPGSDHRALLATVEAPVHQPKDTSLGIGSLNGK
jgi:endonuclease/exonuclease/phosphatase (EEP) superfamily protein YafD